MLSKVVDRCSALGGKEEFPFGEGVSVWKIGGKMFALISKDGSGVNLKCDPRLVEAMVGNVVGIKPGYHMNKRHWITVDPREADEELLLGLVEDSFDLVVEGLPKAERALVAARGNALRVKSHVEQQRNRRTVNGKT